MRKVNTSDVFKMARILKKTNITDEIKKSYLNGKAKGANVEEIGLDLFFSMVGACAKEGVETELYELLGGIAETEPEKIAEQPIETTMKQLKKIAEENNLIHFFKSAGQLTS